MFCPIQPCALRIALCLLALKKISNKFAYFRFLYFAYFLLFVLYMFKFQQILRSETSVFVMNGVNIKLDHQKCLLPE